jgi:hypothetical protein
MEKRHQKKLKYGVALSASLLCFSLFFYGMQYRKSEKKFRGHYDEALQYAKQSIEKSESESESLSSLCKALTALHSALDHFSSSLFTLFYFYSLSLYTKMISF